jgi:transcriptional regulator with XRE-family HTH domain
MGRNFDEISRQVDERLAANPRGAEIRDQARRELEAELAAHAFTLQELRRARDLTQSQLSKALDVSQAQVSRIEKQTDLLLSTLASYVEAMDGELELVARFPGHPPVYLTIGELTGMSEDVDAGARLRQQIDRTVEYAVAAGVPVDDAREQADKFLGALSYAALMDRKAAGLDDEPDDTIALGPSEGALKEHFDKVFGEGPGGRAARERRSRSRTERGS